MTDPIVEQVITEFRERSQRGIAKYKTTLADSPEDMAARLQHLKEELMDALNYIAWIQSNRQQ